jgi:hypothetical protein
MNALSTTFIDKPKANTITALATLYDEHEKMNEKLSAEQMFSKNSLECVATTTSDYGQTKTRSSDLRFVSDGHKDQWRQPVSHHNVRSRKNRPQTR